MISRSTEGCVPKQLLVPVVSNVKVIADHFVITVEAPQIANVALPGHFINVRSAEEGYDPLLRKPFSIYHVDRNKGEVSLLYSVVGAVTRGMERKKAGDFLDIVGPLGGKLFEADTRANALHIMAGGGYGVPPLVFLSLAIQESDPLAQIAFLIGARTKELLLGEAELEAANIPTHITTEDGTSGITGLITDALNVLLLQHRGRPLTIYCCGPTPMMHAVSDAARKAQVRCQVSLEVAMPCGIGVCMGCVMDLANGSRVRCCVDGPVFESSEVSW